MTDAIGWVSSLILLATIVTQIAKQWREKSEQGVSRWLYVGQLTASAGFAVYSALLGNHVFIVTNALLTISALVGLAMMLHFSRRAAKCRY